MSQLNVDTIKKADGTGNLSVPAETGTVVTTASPSLGRRNIIINGAMQVAQRNTSWTGLTTAGYRLDRFDFYLGSFGTWTATQSTDVPTGLGFANSFKIECTTANASLASGNIGIIRQPIEGQNLQQLAKGTASAKNITVSFWVKSNKTGTYIFELYDGDNARQVSASYSVSSSNTWEKKEITIDGDTTGAFDNDNGASLYVQWWLGAGSSFTSGTLNTSWASNVDANRIVGQVNLADTVGNTFQITGVQLEVGSVATPFEHLSYGEELLSCLRYYYAHDPRSNYIMAAPANNEAIMNLLFHVPMRANPSMTHNIDGYSTGTAFSHDVYIGGVVTSRGAGSVSNWGSSIHGAAVASTMSSTTAGDAGNINFGSSVVLRFDAEL